MKTKKRLILKVRFNYLIQLLLYIIFIYLINNISGLNGAFFLAYIDIVLIIINGLLIIKKS